MLDAQGNLYGTTFKGGGYYVGAVFKVDTHRRSCVLVIFLGRHAGTRIPRGTFSAGYPGKLVWHDRGGGLYRFYGTGIWGRVQYNFQGKPAPNPMAGLVLDAQGNLYGTTYSGGTYGDGTVLKLDTTGKETVLYSFTGDWGTAQVHGGGLVLDAEGNLYGTTGAGGSYGYGTVFKLTP